jgi:hypothetical protein
MVEAFFEVVKHLGSTLKQSRVIGQGIVLSRNKKSPLTLACQRAKQDERTNHQKANELIAIKVMIVVKIILLYWPRVAKAKAIFGSFSVNQYLQICA